MAGAEKRCAAVSRLELDLLLVDAVNVDLCDILYVCKVNGIVQTADRMDQEHRLVNFRIE